MYGSREGEGIFSIGRLDLSTWVLTGASRVLFGEEAPGGTGVLLCVVIGLVLLERTIKVS